MAEAEVAAARQTHDSHAESENKQQARANSASCAHKAFDKDELDHRSMRTVTAFERVASFTSVMYCTYRAT